MAWVRRALWAGTLAYWALMFVLTHLPAEQAPRHPSFGDKVGHFIGYMLLGYALGLTLWVNRRGRKTPWVVLAVGVIYGALDETTQPLVGRSAEWGDWFADVGGIAVAAVALGFAQWVVRRWSSDSPVQPAILPPRP